jgi:hypothetical protein
MLRPVGRTTNFAKLLQTSSATVPPCSQAISGLFFELVQLLQRAIGETHLFFPRPIAAVKADSFSLSELPEHSVKGEKPTA